MIGAHVPLDQVFARAVASGWRPRSPAFADEIGRLEHSLTRGDSISPLTVDGDEVFIDPSTPARPGDLVSFTLSARGAEAQNSSLPPGQSLWAKGSRWIKFYDRHHGLDMLFDRHGGAATATLLVCEDPGDTPRLYPLRNIRRAGRLLFTPDHYGSQIGLNAATEVISIEDAGPITATLTAPAASNGYQIKYSELTVPNDWAVEVSATFRVAVSTVSTSWSVDLYALAGSASFPNSKCGRLVNKTTLIDEPVTVIGLHTFPGGGTFRYGIGCFINGDGTSNFTVTFRDMTVRIALVKR